MENEQKMNKARGFWNNALEDIDFSPLGDPGLSYDYLKTRLPILIDAFSEVILGSDEYLKADKKLMGRSSREETFLVVEFKKNGFKYIAGKYSCDNKVRFLKVIKERGCQEEYEEIELVFDNKTQVAVIEYREKGQTEPLKNNEAAIEKAKSFLTAFTTPSA